ncbi:hypothetical protein GWK47_043073 [Chionoecetes opilio]|uniref:Uncharacterized protein n=1 Tax=Chionoecetes opilio TaxID=41210 RepID=A0A8J4Y9M7_CHIOP|nr:hypothetical protein GWK47_043073 [Chionoecetes opilio]
MLNLSHRWRSTIQSAYRTQSRSVGTRWALAGPETTLSGCPAAVYSGEIAASSGQHHPILRARSPRMELSYLVDLPRKQSRLNLLYLVVLPVSKPGRTLKA